jgi:hypothetical protein
LEETQIGEKIILVNYNFRYFFEFAMIFMNFRKRKSHRQPVLTDQPHHFRDRYLPPLGWFQQVALPPVHWPVPTRVRSVPPPAADVEPVGSVLIAIGAGGL